MSKLTRAIEELARRADAGDNASLMFLHNTSAAKLQRVQDMGGMPMPSIAITDKDIPFDSFGDITLVGKTGSFDPKANPLNEAYSADAYTVRAPSPVKVARKGAGKRFKEKFGAKMKELGVYSDDTTANIWDLESKGDVDTNRYNQVVNWFDRNAEALFLDEKGIKFDKDSGRDIRDKTEPFRASGEYKNWSDSQLSEIFDDQEYFITNPNRDYYTQRARLAPYTAEEITKFMKKSSGRGGEGGIFSSGPGSIRAEYTEKLTSLDAMRGRKDRLSGDIGIEKSEIESLIFDYGDALKPFYKYDANGFRYLDEVSDFLKIARKKGLKRAADEVGFENIPQDLMIELEGFQQILKDSPTEYFESKPKRVVQLNEFGGAIVPEGTSQSTIDLLTRQGLEIEQYADDAQRLEARKKFKKLLFQLPPVTATAVISGIAAVSAPDAQAGPLKSGTDAVTELARRADAGDVKAAEGIRAYHGSPYSFDEFSTSQIGTGEGAQAYSRGLYFAEREGTAKSYREALTRNQGNSSPSLFIDGKEAPLESIQDQTIREELQRYIDAWDDDFSLSGKDIDIDEAMDNIIFDAKQERSSRYTTEDEYPEIDQRIREAERLKTSGKLKIVDSGRMYEVNIAATPDEFIDWDLPLDEQSESVMNALKKTDWYKYAEEGATNAAELRGDNAYGMDLVRWLEEDGAEDAAQLLKDAGIKGVQYADAQTRFGKGAKTKNYVVYDDKLIDITRKYGISIPLATAVLAGTMTPEEAQASQGGGLVPFDPAIHTPQDVGLGEPGSVSTEYIATVDAPDGSVMLIPTIWWDAEGNPKLFEREDTDKAIELAIDYEQSTGKQFPRFPAGAYAEADDYAISRSRAGGASQTPLARDTTTGMGGMGVRSAPTAEDEEAMLAAQPPTPTGADLLRQANDEFMGGIMTEPRSYMGDIEQALLGGIMQTAGMADLAADVFSSLAAPVMSAPGAIGRYVADRYIPGVNYSAEDIARERKATEDYFNYQPRTDLGQQYGEQAAQTIGGVIGPYLPAIKEAAGDSYILGAMRKGYDYLGEKEKELAKAMLDLSPI